LLGAFCQKGKFVFLKPASNSAVFYTSHDLFQTKKIFGPLLQEDQIFRGVSEKVMGVKKIFNACSGLPINRHNYLKMLEFDNTNVFKINSPCSARIVHR
jgi:hypothetical protein